MSIYIIGDTHFLHDNIKLYCNRPDGFEEGVRTNLLCILKKDDILIHLGDVCLGNAEFVHEYYIKPIRAIKILLRGNHDKKTITWYYEHNWDFVVYRANYVYNGKRILLSHLPQMDMGQYDINIHAHFHNSEEKYHEDYLREIKNDKQILYALEYVGYKPILLDSFLEENDDKSR